MARTSVPKQINEIPTKRTATVWEWPEGDQAVAEITAYADRVEMREIGTGRVTKRDTMREIIPILTYLHETASKA